MASAIIEEVVEECVEEAVETAVEEAVEGAVEDAVEEAVEDAVEETVEQVNFLKRGESRTFDRGPPPQHTPILVFFFFLQVFPSNNSDLKIRLQVQHQNCHSFLLQTSTNKDSIDNIVV